MINFHDEAELRTQYMSYGLPEHMFYGVFQYLHRGVKPGHFLTAVLENDLKGAVDRADETNMKLLGQWVKFFYNNTPSDCWGSKYQVKEWSSTNRQ